MTSKSKLGAIAFIAATFIAATGLASPAFAAHYGPANYGPGNTGGGSAGYNHNLSTDYRLKHHAKSNTHHQ
jgi:hypothetical protein